MEHVNENKPLKELAFTLIGILLFVGMVALIAVSAWLRPAGDNYVPETVAEADAQAEVNEPTNPTNQADIPNKEASVTDTVMVEESTADEGAPQDTSTTPAALSQEVTVTAEGTVSQEGAELIDNTAPAELTDGDVVAETTTDAEQEVIVAEATADTLEVEEVQTDTPATE